MKIGGHTELKPDAQVEVAVDCAVRKLLTPLVPYSANFGRKTAMWGGIIGLIIQLISGGVGGNIAGAALKQYDLGTIGNTIAGVVGGGVGAQIIGALLGGGAEAAGAGAGNLDIG